MELLQDLLKLINQVSDEQLLLLLMPLVLAFRDNCSTESFRSEASTANQSWVSGENYFYNEFFVDELGTRLCGSVYRVPMPSTQLLQQLKVCPAVLVSPDSLNRVSDDVIVLPCTFNPNCPIGAPHYLVTGDETIAIGLTVVYSIVRLEFISTLNQ